MGNELVRITSPKHPGAIFFKRKGTKDDFICKFYPGKDTEAKIFTSAMDRYVAVRLGVIEKVSR